MDRRATAAITLIFMLLCAGFAGIALNSFSGGCAVLFGLWAIGGMLELNK